MNNQIIHPNDVNNPPMPTLEETMVLAMTRVAHTGAIAKIVQLIEMPDGTTVPIAIVVMLDRPKGIKGEFISEPAIDTVKSPLITDSPSDPV